MVGSQIVGLVPLKAVLDCADFYIQEDKLFVVEEEHKVRLVSTGNTGPGEDLQRSVSSAGLQSLTLFLLCSGDQQAGSGLSGAVRAQGADHRVSPGPLVLSRTTGWAGWC